MRDLSAAASLFELVFEAVKNFVISCISKKYHRFEDQTLTVPLQF